MHHGHRQVIAEKISSTVRVLELLGLEYEVRPPRNERLKGNKSPRVVVARFGNGKGVRIYNSSSGHTWANRDEDGKPIPGIGSVEDLHAFLKKVTRK